ncbi:MAG: DsrE family protein [Gemmatimonadota bacterium]
MSPSIAARHLVLRTSTVAALVAAALVLPETLAAQQSGMDEIPGMQMSGPRIHSGGPTIAVEDPTFVAPADHVFRAVFEINDGSPEDASNMQMGTIARFLNLHARHGVPDERVHAAAVVHGSGFRALLRDDAYGERYDGATNPSRELVEELLANGVQIVLCGQTAGARQIDRDELIPGVQVGWSAMTALNVFQTRGYTFNPW